jgi:hypothetical protein
MKTNWSSGLLTDHNLPSERGRGLGKGIWGKGIIFTKLRKRVLGMLGIVVGVFVLLAGRVCPAAPEAPLAAGPVIEMDKVPLSEAIRQLARQAQLNILLDPRLSEPPFAGINVSIRWEGVSAKEALVALLDNYGLVLVEAARPHPAPAR